MRLPVSMRRIFDPNHPTLLNGSPDDQRQARREWRREKEMEGIMAGWNEMPRSRLTFTRHWIEDSTNGSLYREVFGDPHYASNVCGFYVREDGSPQMLEPHDPPSLAEIERRRAAREQRRAATDAARRAQRQRHIEELR